MDRMSAPSAQASQSQYFFALGLELGSVLGKLRDLCQLVDGRNVLFQSRDIRLGGGSVGFEIVDGVEVLLRSGLEVGVRPLDGDQSLGLLNQAVADGLLAEVHTEAVLRVVLEQGSCTMRGPCPLRLCSTGW